MNYQKLTLALILIAVIVAPIGIGLAVYWVYSNVKTVTVSDYIVDLNTSKNGLQITLTSILYDPQNSPLPGKTVYFYQTDSAGAIIGASIGTNVTDSSGVAQIGWKAPSNGTYYFKAGYQVP